LSCTSSANGTVGVDVLATGDGSRRTRVSYDYARQILLVDQRASCGPTHSGGIVQTAPVALAQEEQVEISVFLDGYMLEVFVNNRTALTALVQGCAFDSSHTAPPAPPSPPVGPPSTCIEASENTKTSIGCPVGETISSVDFASFGAPGGSCVAGFTHNATCDSNHSMAVVKANCVGKNNCSLDATCATFKEILTGPGAFCWVRIRLESQIKMHACGVLCGVRNCSEMTPAIEIVVRRRSTSTWLSQFLARRARRCLAPLGGRPPPRPRPCYHS
jgi:hypothetical protein